jgi:oligoribonuclease NrnB/cAMP/cGMP phosphodiesterase (DHH superfamily)
MENTTVLYHADADGFGAAFAIWLRLHDNAHYIAVQYGQPVPEIPEGTTKLYIVDFSYKREICEELSSKYDLCIYDHHKTAEAELEGLAYATFDMSKSGCVMTWEAFHDDPIPLILQYTQDYDLWKFELPDSKKINLYVQSLPHNFATWGCHLSSSFLHEAREAGVAIERFRDGQVTHALKSVRMMRFFVSDDGDHEWEVPVVNATTNIAEIGNVLCAEYPDAPFSASYCDRTDVRTYSLRSIGDFDVSEVARMFGGGGHKNAAGFTTDIGWPQYQSDEFIEAFDEAVNK